MNIVLSISLVILIAFTIAYISQKMSYNKEVHENWKKNINKGKNEDEKNM